MVGTRFSSPNMSDATILISVEDLINMAMGPTDKNIVNYKLLQTILHILARQLRMLEQRVEIHIPDDRDSRDRSDGRNKKSTAADKGTDKRDRSGARDRDGRPTANDRDKGGRGQEKDSDRDDRGASKDRDRAGKRNRGASKDRDGAEKTDRGASKDRDGAEKRDRGASKNRDRAEKRDRGASKDRDRAERGGRRASKDRDGADRGGRRASKDRDGAERGGRRASKDRDGAERGGRRASKDRDGADRGGRRASKDRDGAERGGRRASKDRGGAERGRGGTSKERDRGGAERGRGGTSKERDRGGRAASRGREKDETSTSKSDSDKKADREKGGRTQAYEGETAGKSDGEDRDKDRKGGAKDRERADRDEGRERDRGRKGSARDTEWADEDDVRQGDRDGIGGARDREWGDEDGARERDRGGRADAEEREYDERAPGRGKDKESRQKDKSDRGSAKDKQKMDWEATSERGEEEPYRKSKKGKSPSDTSITVSEVDRKKEKVLVVEKGPTIRGAGRGRDGIEVVSRGEFDKLAALVRELLESAEPLPVPALPTNEKLRSDLAKGQASLTDTMEAMQVTARVRAAEHAISRMGDLLTQLAASGALPDDMAEQIDEVHFQPPDMDGGTARGLPSKLKTGVSHKSVAIKPGSGPGQTMAGSGPGQMMAGTGPGQMMGGTGPGQTMAGSGPGQMMAGSGLGQMMAGTGPGQMVVGSGPGQMMAGSGPGQMTAGSRPGQMMAEPDQRQMMAGSGPGQVMAGSGPGQKMAGSGPGQIMAGSRPGQMMAEPDQGQVMAGSGPGQVMDGSGPGQRTVGSRPSQATAPLQYSLAARRPSAVSRASAMSGRPGYVLHPDLEVAMRNLREDINKNVFMMTAKATAIAENASFAAKAVGDKIDVFVKLDARISTLYGLTSDYAEQLAGFDSGLTTQMSSFRDQLEQMRSDLGAGLKQLEEVNNNAETAAVLELTERYDGLVTNLDVTLHAHRSLTTYQAQLACELHSLVECVEMLREQKADRDEVLDGLRDKADNSRLEGLLTSAEFALFRLELEKRLEVCHDKFRRQEQVWMTALRDLTNITESKADITQLLAAREEAEIMLRDLQEKQRKLAVILGEPKAAVLTRALSRGATCGACLAPALMEPQDVRCGAPPELPAARPLPVGAEEPCEAAGKLREPPDYRDHACRRWVGGSHTLLSDAVTRERAPPTQLPCASTKKYMGVGDDGRLYKMEEDLQPCVECNKFLEMTPAALVPEEGAGDQAPPPPPAE